ncbi:MAG: TonB-dependent receptor plug domain-containing protein [Opitutaceae bacterium]
MAFAANDAPRPFNVPSDTADKSLKRFSQQSGLEVIFSTRIARAVKTRLVKGTMTARQALDAMLMNTGLIVIQDEKTGAFTVSHGTNGNKTAPKPADDPPPGASITAANPTTDSQPAKKKSESMKTTKNPVAVLGAWLAIVLAPGQAAESAPSTSTPKPDEEVLVLSPFVVNTERDTGYAATNTLAGTRLNTSVKDIGSSISIYTKNFLNDIGATNANELLVYGVGTEAGGAQGNYSGAASSINARQVFADSIFGDGVRTAPQNATRVRGLAAPNYTRGLFRTNIPIDSFNTETVTVNRGPNAILFGVGSPAGVIDAMLLQANLSRNLNQVEFRYGNNDSIRGVLDLNRVLIPNKLALRIAALDDNEKFNQRPAFEHKKRLFGTMTARPFRPTTVRSNFETGRTRASRPLGVLPLHSISSFWYDAGRPVYDWTFYDDPARNPNAASQRAGSATWGFLTSFQQFGDHVGMIYSQPNATAIDNAFRGGLVDTPGTAANAVRANLFHPLVNRDSSAESVNQMPATRNIGEVIAGFYPGGIQPPGIKHQGFTDFSAFDFKNHMIDELGRQSDTYNTFNIAIEQLAWKDRLGIELAYATERYERRATNPFMTSNGNSHVRIDAAVTLPTGQPNPNVGRPFVLSTQALQPNIFNRQETMRATAFARYDFKDASPRLGRWLGRHTLTGLHEKNASDDLTFHNGLITTGPVADAINPAADSFARQGVIQVYVGDSILDGRPLSLQPIRVPAPEAGLSAQTTYFAAPAGSAAQGDFAVAPTTLAEIVREGRASREVIKSQAAVLQSYWLDDHLVTTLGWRRDEDYFASQAISYNAADPTRVAYGFGDFSFPSTPPPLVAKEVKSYSAVLRWPQKLARLPFGADVGIFVNRSENFTPIGGRVNAYNQTLPSPQGKTREYGLNLSFLNERFVLRVNRFETSIEGQSVGGYGNALNNAVLQTAGFWAEEQNINPHIDRSADIELLFSVLPANFRELYQWRVTGTAEQQNLSATHTLISGVTDTTDFTAKGTEAELTFNPSRQWRFLANVANQETVQTNIAPGLREFIARMQPVWDQLAGVPHNNYPTGHVLGTPLPPNIQTSAQYRAQFVDTPLAAIVASEGTASAEQRKWRANFVANYTFASDSRLKGWSVGTGVRWQDKLGLGYPASRDAGGNVIFDLANPYYAPAETNVDLFASYTRKLWGDRIEWKAQLNVRNAIGDGDAIGVTVQPWGETAIARLAPERRWYLTNTFSF